MQPYTPESINGFRAELEAGQFPHIEIARHGRVYKCYVLPQGIKHELPDFALPFTPHPRLLRISKEPENITVFCISDSIRKNVRDLVGGHEIDEFTQIGIETPGRCQMASAMEIQSLSDQRDLSETEIREYLQMRISYFQNLQEYAASKSSFTPADINDFAESQRVFGEALAKRNCVIK